MFAVLDTNHFREYVLGTASGAKLKSRIEIEKPEIFTCIVAAEESLSGWIAFIRRERAGAEQLTGYEMLHRCLDTLVRMSVLPFDRDAALLFHSLQKSLPRIGTMDLKIAAICLAHDATLLSRNLVDFEKVPGLKIENWLD